MRTVGIIGLGKIAAMYATPESVNPYCHVGGILQSGKVVLKSVADSSPQSTEAFRNVWGGVFPELEYFYTAGEMLAAGGLDIVAVCVRGPYHFDVVMQVLRSDVKAVFLEKPPSCSLEEMDAMTALARERGIPITVSYSRHWRPGTLRMAELAAGGLIGDVRTIIGYTGKWVLSFGIHTTDLICQFAGSRPVAVYATGTIADEEAPAGYEPEPILSSMVIEFENGVTGIQAGTEGEHGSFYCDVVGSGGSLRAGMYTTFAARNEKRETIDLDPLDIPPDRSVFAVAYEEIAGYLDGGPVPACTDDAFIVVNEIGFAAIESIHTGKRITIPNVNRSRKIFANH